MYYNPILRVNINMHMCHLRASQALAWVRVAMAHGVVCHVASMWVPRALAHGLFIIILIVLIDLISKYIQKILEKSLKIRKFIAFKIQLQINPDFFHWIRNSIIYHYKKSNI